MLNKCYLKYSNANQCLFLSNGNQQKWLPALHIDVGLLATTSQIKNDFLEEPQNQFKVTYKDAEFYLDIEIKTLIVIL